MWRILLRVVVVLLVVQGLLTFAIAPVILPRLSKDLLAFAQHGFAFVFLALLNLVMWQVPDRTIVLRYVVHGCNVVFFAFNLLFSFVNPEAPTFISTGILLLLAFSALGMDWTHRRELLHPVLAGGNQ